MGYPLVTLCFTLTYITNHPSPKLHSSELPTSGPLSCANDALPWIIFVRDRVTFEREFPHWHIELVKPIMPFRYLLSGGVSLRSLNPSLSAVSMEAKADYPAPLDDEEVQRLLGTEKQQPHHQDIIL